MDSDAIKAKYAEIAALKKAIADRGLSDRPSKHPSAKKAHSKTTPYSRPSGYSRLKSANVREAREKAAEQERIRQQRESREEAFQTRSLNETRHNQKNTTQTQTTQTNQTTQTAQTYQNNSANSTTIRNGSKSPRYQSGLSDVPNETSSGDSPRVIRVSCAIMHGPAQQSVPTHQAPTRERSPIRISSCPSCENRPDQKPNRPDQKNQQPLSERTNKRSVNEDKCVNERPSNERPNPNQMPVNERPSNERPVNPNQMPVNERPSNERPVNPNQIPVNSNKIPVNHQMPVNQNKSPVHSNQHVKTTPVKAEASVKSTTPANAYVTHVNKSSMKLVNSAAYADQHERYLQIERLRELQELKAKNEKRQYVLKQRAAKNRGKTDDCDRILIEGAKYAVTCGGVRLVPITMQTVLHDVSWNGKQYTSRKSGVLRSSKRTPKNKMEMCRYFSRTGICRNGAQCKYPHDKARIRVCKQQLMRGCQNRNCLLNHELNEFNTPLCKYFLQGKCANTSCKYSHHKPLNYDNKNYQIWLCRPFAMGGWCARGRMCPFMHEWNCPDYEEDGVCPRGQSCTLGHPITRRTQELMLNQHSYTREEDEVFVEPDTKVTVQNSYNVDPSVLFKTPILDGKYDVYIDNSPDNSKTDSNFLIGDSSDESFWDDLEENIDFVTTKQNED